jgi:TatD DNase family protein
VFHRDDIMSLPPLTDIHAHLDYAEYDADRDAAILRACQAGVVHVITTGIGRDSIAKTLKLAERHDELHATVGVHPTDLDALRPDEWSLLEEASRHPRVVAIGETGLDYFHLKTADPDSEKKRQRDYFLRSLDLARRANKPAVVHCRDAYDDTLAILKEFGRFRDAPGVMHCFGGTRAIADRVFELGYTISAGGILTFKNAPTLRELVSSIPHDRLLLETDCPYLAPMPHRGKRNEPAYVRLVAEKVAELWKQPLEKTLAEVAANVKRVFGIG